MYTAIAKTLHKHTAHKRVWAPLRYSPIIPCTWTVTWAKMDLQFISCACTPQLLTTAWIAWQNASLASHKMQKPVLYFPPAPYYTWWRAKQNKLNVLQDACWWWSNFMGPQYFKLLWRCMQSWTILTSLDHTMLYGLCYMCSCQDWPSTLPYAHHQHVVHP